MQKEEKIDQGRRCPTCGHQPLQPQVIRDEFEYGPDEERIAIVVEAVPVLVCPHCGETLYGPEASRLRCQAICRSQGLLTSEQVKAVRERLDMSQSEFARLTGIGVATLSRWERGRLLQTKALDRYLRVLGAFPEVIPWLESLARQLKAPESPWRCLQVTAEIRERENQFRQRRAPNHGGSPKEAAEAADHTASVPSQT
jgi:putative zinc finger/helix-turn-helix YgiT family protein